MSSYRLIRTHNTGQDQYQNQRNSKLLSFVITIIASIAIAALILALISKVSVDNVERTTTELSSSQVRIGADGGSTFTTGDITFTGGTGINVTRTNETILIEGSNTVTITSLDASVNVIATPTGVDLSVESAPIGTVVDSITVYANAGTGSNANDGLSSGTPVQTLTRAIDILGEISPKAKLCTIQLQGATAFDLGDDPVLCFFPAVVNCKHIIVKGTRDDVVTAAMVANPGAGLLYTAVRMGPHIIDAPVLTTDYSTHFAQNLETGKIAVVDQTPSNTTFVPLAPANFEQAATGLSDFPFNVSAAPNQRNYFSSGDTVEFFKVGTTQIIWTNQLTLDIPSNEVTFQAIVFDLTGGSGNIIAPDDATHRTRFSGCRIQTSNQFIPVTSGSMIWQGVSIINSGSRALDSPTKKGLAATCIIMDSVYIEDMAIQLSSCLISNSHFKSSNPTSLSRTSTASQQQNANVNIVNTLFESIITRFSIGSAQLFFTEFYGPYPDFTVFDFRAPANVYFLSLHVAISNNIRGSPLFDVESGSTVSIQNPTLNVPWTGFERLARVNEGSSLILIPCPPLTTQPSAGAPQPIFSLENDSTLYMEVRLGNLISNINNVPIVTLLGGARLTVTSRVGNTAVPDFSTPPGIPLIDARADGARVHFETGPISNSGGVTSDILYCGNTVMDVYTASTGTAFTICTR